MNCEQARGLMMELLDGGEAEHPELASHVGGCAECGAQWRLLQRIERAAQADARCEVPVESRERGIVAVLRRAERQQTRGIARGWRPRWAAVAALLVGVFVVGVQAGRTVWPRETVVTRIVRVPEVRERIVEVKVPVVEERLIVKRIPVVKKVRVVRTRIVYREREAPEVTPAPEPALVTQDASMQPDTSATEPGRHVEAASDGMRGPSFDELESPEMVVGPWGPDRSSLVVTYSSTEWPMEGLNGHIDYDVFLYTDRVSDSEGGQTCYGS